MEDRKRLIINISVVLGILIVLLLVLFFVGKSLGIFKYEKHGDTRSVVSVSGLKVTILDNTEDNLDLLNAYPMPDSEGLLRSPIVFNIENTGVNRAIDFTLKLVNDIEAQTNCHVEGTNDPCTALSANKIRYAYKIGNGSYNTPANLGENENIIFSDTIDGGETIKVSLVIWIDKEAGNEIQGSYFMGNLLLTGEKHSNNVEYTFDGIDTNTGQPVTSYDFIAPTSGTYRLEVWGASGGANRAKDGNGYVSNNRGGYGGYSVGEIYLEENTPLYIVLGGEGGSVISDNPSYSPPLGLGGNNGGGNGGVGYNNRFPYGCGGGGATHISTEPGLLKDLSSNRDAVLIVAGGGGGAAHVTAGGNGGGSSSSSYATTYGNSATIATQTTGYAFGLGQNGSNGIVNAGGASGTGAGGGGWYGGYAYTSNTNGKSTGGAGGSGYLKSTLTNKGMYCYDCTDVLTDVNTFTVKTNGTSEYKNTEECPNGYSDEPIAKCAKQGAGRARITYLEN